MQKGYIMEQLNEFAAKHGVNFERKLLNELISIATFKVVPKGKLLQSIGEKTDVSGIVLSGITRSYYLDNDGGKSSIYNVNALGTVMFTLPIYKNTGVFCDATGILALPYNRNVKMIKVERDEPYTSTKIQDRVFNKCAPGIFGEFGVYQDFNLSNDHNMRIALGYGYGSYNPLKGYENAGFDGYSIPIQNYNKQQLNRLTVKILFLY